MGIEILKTMNEGMYPSLLLMMEIVALVTGLFALVGLVICLAGIAWLCFEEIRQPSRRRMKSVPEPGKPRPMATPPALGDRLNGNLTKGLSRREPAV